MLQSTYDCIIVVLQLLLLPFLWSWLLVILMMNKIDFKTKNVTGDKEGHL